VTDDRTAGHGARERDASGTDDGDREENGDTIRELASAVTAADHVVALTGAGVSTASGIPDFRSEDGIWADHDPAEFEYSRFRADPGTFWRKWVDLRASVYDTDVEPNAAHEALVGLERTGALDALVTQNIDGLHGAAGSESVLRLHGDGRAAVCDACGDRTNAGPVHERVAAGEGPPECGACGGTLKPDVVLFGERLPQGPLQEARRHARQADVFLAVGSSLTVEPAASIPRVAARHGGTLAVVNLEETPVSGRADYDLRRDVTRVLPALERSIRS
jgi:NAD-dependent deacetylase